MKANELRDTGYILFTLIIIGTAISMFGIPAMAAENSDRDWGKIIPIDPKLFKIQGGNEFILDTKHGVDGKLGHADGSLGADLTRYNLQFSFKNGDGLHVQLWYKDQEYHNVYSWEKVIDKENPILFNPTIPASRNVDEFSDFSHIYAIGVSVREGIKGKKPEILTSRLVRR